MARFHAPLLSALVAAGCLTLLLRSGAAQDVPEPPVPNDDYQILTRGPMHEAFADPYTNDPEPGIVVPEQPPEPINELPPEAVPEGDNVVWIPGYWGWGPEEQDFLWISGVWRDLPPERQWVPGYWTEVQDGWQWISGFWTNAQAQELSYLPDPPESLEEGPSVEAPSEDYFWVPGCWIWTEDDYRWRPGYWAPAQEEWVWIPDHYSWTPYGCLFVQGFWDYQLPGRGTLFAPVHFTTPVYTQPAFRYSPAVTVGVNQILVHLFVSPRYRHYYYGDYYAANNSNFNLVPWYSYGTRRAYYDPLLSYYRWSYGRQNVNFVQRLQVWNRYFIDNRQYRPRATFQEQQQFAARFRDDANVPLSQVAYMTPLNQLVAEGGGRRRFRELDENRRQEFAQAARQFRRVGQNRIDLEVAQAGRSAPDGAPGDAPRGDRQRRERRLQLPQTVTALRPNAETEDQLQTPDVPGDRSGRSNFPPPARPQEGDDAPPRRGERGERAGRGDAPPDRIPGRDPRGDDRGPQLPDLAPGDNRDDRLGRNRDGRDDRPGPDLPVDAAPGEDNSPANTPDRPGRQPRGEDRPGIPRGAEQGDRNLRPDRPGAVPGQEIPGQGNVPRSQPRDNRSGTSPRGEGGGRNLPGSTPGQENRSSNAPGLQPRGQTRPDVPPQGSRGNRERDLPSGLVPRADTPANVGPRNSGSGNAGSGVRPDGPTREERRFRPQPDGIFPGRDRGGDARSGGGLGDRPLDRPGVNRRGGDNRRPPQAGPRGGGPAPGAPAAIPNGGNRSMNVPGLGGSDRGNNRRQGPSAGGGGPAAGNPGRGPRQPPQAGPPAGPGPNRENAGGDRGRGRNK